MSQSSPANILNTTDPSPSHLKFPDIESAAETPSAGSLSTIDYKFPSGNENRLRVCDFKRELPECRQIAAYTLLTSIMLDIFGIKGPLLLSIS